MAAIVTVAADCLDDGFRAFAKLEIGLRPNDRIDRG